MKTVYTMANEELVRTAESYVTDALYRIDKLDEAGTLDLDEDDALSLRNDLLRIKHLLSESRDDCVHQDKT